MRLWERFPTGIRYMAGSALFFSLMSLCVKLAGQTLPALEIVLARGVVLSVATYGLIRRAGMDPWGDRRGLLLLRGLFGLVALVCFYSAVIHLPLADATVIQYTNPVWTALLAAVLLGERLRGIETVGIVASLAGVLLIARPTFLFGAGARGLDPLWVGVGLAGAVFSAAAYVTVRELGSSEDALVIVFWFALVNTAGALPAALPAAVWPTAGEWALLAGVGLSALIAQILMTMGLERERAGRAMAIGYLQIVFAAVWGFIFFDEIPDALAVLGALMVVGGTFVAGRRHRGQEASDGTRLAGP